MSQIRFLNDSIKIILDSYSAYAPDNRDLCSPHSYKTKVIKLNSVHSFYF